MRNRVWPIYALVMITALLLSWYFKDLSKSLQPTKYLNPPPEELEYFTFGFRESMADSLWLRWIQDSDVCQTYGGLFPSGVRLEPNPVSKDIFFNPRNKKCDNSWGFKMLDAVTRLAPLFKMPYMAGTMSLSVLVEDYDGAGVLFERGLKYYPNDWQLLYRAAYHFLFDRQDLVRGADLLNRAAQSGGPYWVRFLAARAYTKAGQSELALTVLDSYRKTLNDENKIKEVEAKIKELKRQTESQ